MYLTCARKSRVSQLSFRRQVTAGPLPKDRPNKMICEYLTPISWASHVQLVARPSFFLKAWKHGMAWPLQRDVCCELFFPKKKFLLVFLTFLLLFWSPCKFNQPRPIWCGWWLRLTTNKKWLANEQKMGHNLRCEPPPMDVSDTWRSNTWNLRKILSSYSGHWVASWFRGDSHHKIHPRG